MLLPVFLLAACLCRSNADTDPAVSALVTKFRHFNESSDAVGSFETLGEDSRELFRLGQPVGILLLDAMSAEAPTTNQTSIIADIHKLFQIPDGMERAYFGRPRLTKDCVFKSMQNLTDANIIATDRQTLIATIKDDLYNIFVHPHFLHTPRFDLFFYTIHRPVTIYGLKKTRTLAYQDKVNLGELLLFYNDLRGVREDLLRLVLVKSMIGNITYPTNPSDYFGTPPHDYNEAETTVKVLAKTGREMADWARKIEDLAWPEIGIQTARDVIDSEATHTFEKTSIRIQKTLQKQGSRKYNHEVLVVPTDKKIHENYANITHFDIYITRIYRNESDEIVMKVNSSNEEFTSSIIFYPLYIIILLFNCIR